MKMETWGSRSKKNVSEITPKDGVILQNFALICIFYQLKRPENHQFASIFRLLSGERGIRTPGSVTFNGFQDRRIRPLCHLSGAKIGAEH
jgi:hypothetical protein